MRQILTCSALILALAQAQEPPRAIPIETNTESAPRAAVVEDPAPPRAAVVTDAPSRSPGQDLFDYGMLAYEQKSYDMAANSFGQYLTAHPSGSLAAPALYRLGNCYRLLKQYPEASKFYREVIERYSSSESAASAAYWEGALCFEARDHKAAAVYFNFCETKAKETVVKLAAGYYLSEAQQLLGDRDKQLTTLKRVMSVTENNPYLELSRVSAATIYQLKGRNNEALPILLELSKTAKDGRVRTDATLKAAIVLTELKRPEEAEKLYQGVLNDRQATDEIRGTSLVGLVTALYDKGDYDAVIDTYNRNASLLPAPDLRPKLLLQVGNAHRLKKSYARAVDTYSMVEEYYGQSDAAFEAGYWKVNCLYLLEDKQLADAANDYVRRHAEAKGSHEFLHMARLMVAETYFAKNSYKLAADSFANMDISKLPKKFQESALYHKGWAESESSRHNEAINTLGQFITQYPKSLELPTALAKQGVSFMQSKDNGKALACFQRLIKDFPENPGNEMSYYLSGVIYNDKGTRNVDAMIESFETLLSKYPTTSAYGEAAFNCGAAYLEKQDFDKAIPHLRKAIRTDSKNYGERGTQKLLLALWSKQDVDNLAPEVDGYRGTVANAQIPPNLLAFLGLAYNQRKEYHRAAKYFTWAANFDTPSQTDLRIWLLLAEAQLNVKMYPESIVAIDHYLASAEENMTKAKAYHTKALAMLGQGKLAECIAAADEGLKLAKAGGVQGELLIAQGDALLKEGDQIENQGNHDAAKLKWKEAAARFVVPSQVLTHATITPMALERAAKALVRMGEGAKAQQMKEELKRDYPTYVSTEE
jgi:tetratricopeptide (TPR) repeat protein